MKKNGILKDYLMFVYKKNPEYGEIRSNFDQKLCANFIDMSLVIFSHESLLEYKTILKKKLF